MKRVAPWLVVLATSYAAHAGAEQRISARELSIGGVVMGQQERDVTRRLGQPRSRTDTGEGFKLSYTGIEIDVGVGNIGVFDVISTGTKYCTPSKLCPGMPASKARGLYGEPVIAKREAGTFLEYQPRSSTCWLQIGASEGVIRSIRIACQP